MEATTFFRSEIHVPGHSQPTKSNLKSLKAKVDERNLTDMWDMILMLDYHVANVDELNSQSRHEFCGVISLLLRAFSE